MPEAIPTRHAILSILLAAACGDEGVAAQVLSEVGARAGGGGPPGGGSPPGDGKPAQPPPFVLAESGCPMAHCDPAMSDAVRMPAPTSVASTWADASASGASVGLGCSSNATIAVCSLGSAVSPAPGPYLLAYDGDGVELWSSGAALGPSAFTSAPLVDAEGGVIAADDATLVRFAPGGGILWSTATPGGSPISPTLARDGTLFVATKGGPISAYDSGSGDLLAELDLLESFDGREGRFETTNTPGARGQRFYVSTELRFLDGGDDPGHHARLYAIDVEPKNAPDQRLRVAWIFEFGARSGASPLVVEDLVIFDGDRTTPDGPFEPRFFAVRDAGDHPELVWQHEIGGPSMASAARDPRGGAWVFAAGDSSLVRLSEQDGAVLQSIDVAPLVPAAGIHRPSSAISVAEGPDGQPILLGSARAPSSVYLVAIDAEAETALWTHHISNDAEADLGLGQWPIVRRPDGQRAIVFSTARNGVRAVVGP